MTDETTVASEPHRNPVSDDDARKIVSASKLAALDDGRVMLQEMFDFADEQTAKIAASAFARAACGWPPDMADYRRLVAGEALVKLLQFIKDNEAEIMAIAKRRRGK